MLLVRPPIEEPIGNARTESRQLRLSAMKTLLLAVASLSVAVVFSASSAFAHGPRGYGAYHESYGRPAYGYGYGSGYGAPSHHRHFDGCGPGYRPVAVVPVQPVYVQPYPRTGFNLQIQSGRFGFGYGR